MAIKFKGDTSVAIINSIKKAEVDTVYRCFDSGVLLSNEVINHGDFVSWDGTKWIKRSDLSYLISDAEHPIEQQVDNLETAVTDIESKIPSGATEENKLVTESGMENALSVVVAAALDVLDARIRSIEEAISATNLGERTADRLDVQTLLVGGEDVTERLNNI